MTACQFEKRLTLYQSGRMLRSLGTLHQPHAVTYIPSPGRDCIALAEGHQVGSIGMCTLTLQCYQKHTFADNQAWCVGVRMGSACWREERVHEQTEHRGSVPAAVRFDWRCNRSAAR